MNETYYKGLLEQKAKESHDIWKEAEEKARTAKAQYDASLRELSQFTMQIHNRKKQII